MIHAEDNGQIRTARLSDDWLRAFTEKGILRKEFIESTNGMSKNIFEVIIGIDLDKSNYEA